MATGDPRGLADSVINAWQSFEMLVAEVDLDGPTRAKGHRVRDLVIPLGAWDDNRPLAQLRAEARAGSVGTIDQGALVDQVRISHAGATDQQVRAAIARQGEEAAQFLAHFDGDPSSEQMMPVASMLGTMPLATYLHAACYPLATTSLDLEPAQVAPPQSLVDSGLVSLVDTIGSLAARQGLTASIAAITTTIRAGSGAAEGAWRTRLLSHDEPVGPHIAGTTRLLLDITSGRADVPTAYRRGQFKLEDIAGLLALAPVVEQVPGIPGRAALLAVIRTTSALSNIANALRRFGRTE